MVCLRNMCMDNLHKGDNDDNNNNNNNVFIYLVFQRSTEGTYRIVYGIKWKRLEPFQVKDMNDPKLAQKNKVLYKRFRVMHSEGNPIIEPMIIKKVHSFCN